MKTRISRDVIVGLFVTIAIIIFIVSVYIIGSKKYIFSRTMEVVTVFKDVNGLQEGNNVRFRGIDVGTIKKIKIQNDSSVIVTLLIKNDISPYIKRNTVASIATDGLMGNKLLALKYVEYPAEDLRDGDTLTTVNPLETDKLIRTLSSTNENINAITADLRNFTSKMNDKNSVWSLMADTVLAENLKTTLVNIKMVSRESAIISGNLKMITNDIRNGKGSLGALITDTSLSYHLNQVVIKFEKFNDSTAIILGDISKIMNGLQNGQGSIGVLLKDTTFVYNLNESMKNIRKGSATMNEDLEALKHSFLLKRYFKKQQKNSKK